MPLTTLLYTPSIDGQQIDQFIKTQCRNSNPNTQNVGLIIHTSLLTKLYTDFSTTLQTSLVNFLNQAQITFIGAPSTTITWGTLILNQFNTKISSSAQIIDSKTKSQCVGKQPQECGKIYYATLFEQIFNDVCDVISKSIANCGNTSTVIIPPGAIAPPHVGTITPNVAMLQIQYDSTMLHNLLSSTLNKNTAMQLSHIVDIQIKAQCVGKNEHSCGSIIHNVILQTLSNKIKTELQTHIKNYITQIKRYIIPLGALGTNPSPPPPTLPTSAIVFGVVQ